MGKMIDILIQKNNTMKKITKVIENGKMSEAVQTICDCCGRDFATIEKTHIGDIKMGSLKINYVSIEHRITTKGEVEIEGEVRLDDLCGSCLKELRYEIMLRKEYLRDLFMLPR